MSTRSHLPFLAARSRDSHTVNNTARLPALARAPPRAIIPMATLLIEQPYPSTTGLLGKGDGSDDKRAIAQGGGGVAPALGIVLGGWIRLLY